MKTSITSKTLVTYRMDISGVIDIYILRYMKKYSYNCSQEN